MSPPVTTPESIAGRCEALRSDGFDFFVVGPAPNLARFDLRPFGVTMTPVPVFAPNPLGWDTVSFLKLFHSMDTHVFASRGLTMPNWVLVDHAVLSSGLVIVACDPERFDEISDRFALTDDERFVLTSLKAEAVDSGFTGPIPVASYCASPTADPQRRVGWSLCSVIPRSGFGFMVKGLALGVFRTRFLIGTTQYDNVALRVHTKFGPARLRAAVTEIHTAPHTLVYETDCRRWLGSADAPEPAAAPTWLVSATDSDRQREMQDMIDARSHTLTILPPGISIEGADRFVPILVSDYIDPDVTSRDIS